MSSPFAVRPATVADLVAVSSMLGETWHASYDSIYGRDRVSELTARWHSPDKLLGGLANKNGVFLVVDHESSIAGTASAVSDDCGAHVDLLRLYVRPSHQGGGLGAKLLEATLRRFPRAQDIALDVEPANLRAIAFYQRQGFVAAATVSDCSGSGDGIPALHMVRKTTAWSAT